MNFRIAVEILTKLSFLIGYFFQITYCCDLQRKDPNYLMKHSLIDWQQQWGLQIIIEFEGNQETDLDDDEEDSL